MKFSKKLLSFLLVMVMMLGMIPVTVQAETAEPTVSTESNVSVEGTNSFGNLLSDAIAEAEAEEVDDEGNGLYSVTDLTIEGNTATVTYEAMEQATLVVAIYSEDGMQLITSGKTTVSPDLTEAEVTIEGEMPEFFEAAAYLVDAYDYSPLCDAYTSPMYTQEMQQLLNSTIHDYDEELVLNLDEDETTNFAVYNSSVVRIEPIENTNTMATIDHENGIFVFENADAQITSLTAGTIFTYAWAEDELLIARVGQILIDGTTVTITGSELKIEEVFDHLKLETAGDCSRMEYDSTGCSEGVTFQGFVEETGKPATRAWEDDVTLKKKSIYFKISLESQDESSIEGVEASLKGSVTGELTLTAYPKLEYYLSFKKQHISVTADIVGDLNVSFEGSLSESASLGRTTFPSPVSGIKFTAEPKAVLSFKMTAVLHVVMTMQVGFGYSSSDGVQNLCTKPKLEMDSYVEGTLSFGIEMEISSDIIDKDIASIGFTIFGGVQLTARLTGTAYESPPRDTAPKKHTCEECIDITVDQVREFSIWARLFKYIKIEKTIRKTVNHLFDMYYSLESDNPGRDYGKCPNYVYRVTVKVQDKAGNPAVDQEVFLKDGNSLGKTDKKGNLPVYLPSGEYTFETTIGEETLSVTRNVKNATRVVLTNNPEFLRRMELYNSLLINSINITAHDTYGQGVFSSGVTWKLYRSGQMIISGEGAMDNYNSASKAPWHYWRNKITELEIENGVTNVGSYAFSDCINLKKVILADSVTSIGSYAFQRCNGLTEIRLPVDYTCQSNSFSGTTGIQKVQYGCGEDGTMPDRSSSTYGYSLEYNSRNALQTVIFEEGITNVASYAFYGSTALRNVYFADTITEIGQYAFYDSGVLIIELPENMAKIGYKAFENSDLTEVYFPDSLESIAKEAFANCFNLKEIVIPDHMSTGISAHAFFNCTGLKKVTVPADYELLEDGIFENCSSVENIHYTPGTTGIMTDRGSWNEDYDYTSTLEFACRSSLKSITFDEGITHIGNYAFCSGNTSVLECVELPSTLESIGQNAFCNTALTTIELPKGLKTIDSYAFHGSKLTSITFTGDAPVINSSAFGNVTATAYYPSSNDTWTADKLQNYGGTLTWVELGKDEGEPTEPEPTEPEATEPELTEPVPTEPEETEPELTEPVPTEPEITEPVPTEPEATEPELTEPEPTEPEPTDSPVTESNTYLCVDLLITTLGGSTDPIEFGFYPHNFKGDVNNYTDMIAVTAGEKTTVKLDLDKYLVDGELPGLGFVIFGGPEWNTMLEDYTYDRHTITISGVRLEGGQSKVFDLSKSKWASGQLGSYTNANNFGVAEIGSSIVISNGIRYDGHKITLVEDTQLTMTATESTETPAAKKKPATRAVFGGEYTSVELDSRTVHTARFSELIPGESYVLIAVLDIEAEDLLAPGNLLAIRQDIAAEDGTLIFDYVQRQQADVSYVFAAGPSNQNLEDAQITFPVMTANGEVQTIEPVVTYNGKVLSEEADYILIGLVDYSEPGEYTCYVRGLRQYTGLVKCVYTVKEMEMAGWSLSLGDSIGVNFYVTVGDNLINDAVVKITVDGEATVHPVANACQDPDTGSYVFTAQVAAAQMTAPVTVELIVEGKTISTKTYTVRQYAEYILDESNGYDAATVSLVTEMLRYGAAAQLYFDCNTDNLANAGYNTALTAAMPADAPAVVKKGVVPGVSFYGASLLFREQVTVRYYFKLSKDISDYSFHAGDTVCTAVAKDGLYYVDVPGINPQNMDQLVNLTVRRGDFSLTVGYSPLHYIIRMYHKAESPDTLKELLLAMYSYHTAAKSYAN